MAREPEELVVRILREMQAAMADHGRILKDHSQEFRKIHREIGDLQETIVTSAGVSLKSAVKAENLQNQIDMLEDRLKRIEDKLSEKA